MSTIKSFAKINLTLEVLEKLPSGYHNIESIFQKISLHDNISIEEIPTGIEISCNNPEVPIDNKNICWQVAEILQKKFNIKQGVKITIDKQIPMGAGLGGGSSNAGAVLLELNKFWNLKLGTDELIEISQQVGKDIPFFITPLSTSLVQGLGEKVTDVEHLSKLYLILINPGIHVSTAWAYNNLTLEAKKYQNAASKMIEALQAKNLKNIIENLYNDFEESVFIHHPEIRKVKEELKKHGALNSLMSGSGSTVYGVFKNEEQAKSVCGKLKDEYEKIYLAETT